ncbi:MAG: c-type cytochrome [Gammaproteobacteria bacterium]|jgi:cytochrome c5
MKKLTVMTICAGMVMAASGAAIADGAATYKEACAACHATGAAGAPKLGDKAAWEPRIATGNDAMYAAVLQGKGAMPAKGGRVDLSDDVVKAAVDYMVAQSK